MRTPLALKLPTHLKGSSSKGFSLVEVMIAVGIASVAMLAFSSMISNQQKETHALTEKFGTLSLKGLLLSALANGSVCLYELNNPTVLTFDSSSAASIAAASINVNQLHASYNGIAPGPVVAQVNTQASADSTTLWINPAAPAAPPGIQLTGFQGAGTTYTANWTINFNTSKLIRPLNPITIPVTLTADNTTPALTKITGCMSGVANFSAATPAAKGLNIVYQNAGSTPRFVKISYSQPSSGTVTLYAGSTPALATTQVVDQHGGSGGTGSRNVSFIVPPGWYYSAVTDTAGGMVSWWEVQ
jgi:prepilin-type N-terminal cleavage/methylation domain-containing protein